MCIGGQRAWWVGAGTYLFSLDGRRRSGRPIAGVWVVGGERVEQPDGPFWTTTPPARELLQGVIVVYTMYAIPEVYRQDGSRRQEHSEGRRVGGKAPAGHPAVSLISESVIPRPRHAL